MLHVILLLLLEDGGGGRMMGCIEIPNVPFLFIYMITEGKCTWKEE